MTQKRYIEFDEGWNFIQTGIIKLKRILEGNGEAPFSSDEYMLLYTMVYTLCAQKPPNDYAMSGQLYHKLKESYDDYISSVVLPSLRAKHDEFMLRELVNRWTNHKVMTRFLSHFFAYLDRYHTVAFRVPTVKEVGLACFHDLVYQDFKVNARDAVIAQIDQEREGHPIDRALLKNVLDLFVEIRMGVMDFYENDFEDSMLNDTAAYYSRKASNWIIEDSCAVYMLKAEECLKREKDRVSHYLHSRSETKLLEIVKKELLVVNTNQLLEEHSGCRVLLRDNKLEDISRMYRLFQIIPNGLEQVADMFKQQVTSEGTVLVQLAEDAASNKVEKAGEGQEQTFIRKTIELYDKYSAIVTDCLCNLDLFHKALKEAFEILCNKTVGGSTSAELLASFCDDVLRKGGSEKLTDETVEDTLDKVVKLLAHISDKDLFAEFYRKKLSRRQLFDKSANDNHERLILTKLKQQYGGQFTSKMERILIDLTLAKENYTHFLEYLNQNETVNPGIDFFVTVLTTATWPSYKSSDLILPEEIAKCVQVFKDFYETRTKHRRLTWIYSLGTCSINGKFDEKTIELILGTYQAAVLLLFNSSDRLSYSDIKTQLNLGDEDLVRVLQSLACAKYKILIKEPNTKSVSTNDLFMFNSKFTDKMSRIRVPLPPVDERKKVVLDVDNNRRFAIDAAIVRTMKSRKVLAYQRLLMECVEQMGMIFKPEIRAIKLRIEDLITREYLERDEENPDVFRYLA